jgi:hypothetical protein
MQPIQDFFVLGENVFRVQPHKMFLLRPAMKQVSARILAWNALVPEARDTRHHNVRVHHVTLFFLPRFRPQW